MSREVRDGLSLLPVVFLQTNSQYAYIMCSTTSVSDDGQTCEDQGNIKEYWTSPAQNPHTQYDTSRLQVR